MRLPVRFRTRALAITAIYTVVGTLWILFSDRALAALVPDPERFVYWSAWKGTFYVAATALLLFVLIARAFSAIEDGYASLRAKERELREGDDKLRASQAALERDIAERQRAEGLIAGQNRILAIVAQGASLETSLTELIRFLEDQSPDALCSVLLLDDSGQHVRHGAGPSLPKVFLDAIDGAAIGPRAGSCGTAAYRREPVYVEDIATDPLWADYRHLALPHGLRACWSTPIFDRERRVLGTFAIYHRKPGLPTERHRQLVTIATQLAAIAIGRARVERELRESEQRFHAFMDASPAIAWVTDDQGRHVWMNRAWSAAFGKDRDDYVGRTAAELVPPEEAARIRRRDESVLERDCPLQVPEETGIIRGERFYWNLIKFPFRNPAGGRFIGGIAIDITERKRAEAALQRAEERLRVVVDHLHEGLIVADPDGEHVHLNPAARRMLGFPVEGDGRRPHRELLATFRLETPEGVAVPRAEWPLARVGRGEELVSYELRIRRDGHALDRVLAFSGSRVRDSEGRELAFVTFRDITERRRAERLLREINETLERKVVERTTALQSALERAESADRLKSAFLATMSHELRTPLNSIIGFTGIMAQGLAGPLTDEQRKQLAMVQGSSRHLLDLINDVLDLSKIEAGQLEVRAEPFAPGEAVERAVATVRPMAERKGLTLEVRAAPALRALVSDRRRVEQVLLNLLNNAVKFTDRGGVTVTLAAASLPPFPGGQAPRDGVRIAVADTGIGIRAEDLGHLFQPFRQVDSGLTRAHDGTGLGLSICRRLCDLLEGDIAVESAFGAGSTFTVTFPFTRTA